MPHLLVEEQLENLANDTIFGEAGPFIITRGEFARQETSAKGTSEVRLESVFLAVMERTYEVLPVGMVNNSIFA